MIVGGQMDIEPIIKTFGKQVTRVLRPVEYELLFQSCSKYNYQVLMSTLLYTGARYSEICLLYKHQDMFRQTGHIYVRSTKTKAKEKDRYIKLNQNGIHAVRAFLNIKTNLEWPPASPNLYTDIRRWAEKAELDLTGIGVRMFRKTWEAWLGYSYPNALGPICLSQGHTDAIGITHYATSLPLSNEDKVAIKKATQGWLDE